MNSAFRNEISLNGYSLPILKSGLQKYIRRGELTKALYCAGELDLFKGIEGGERIRTNFFHRLIVILLEDVCNIPLLIELYPDLKFVMENRADDTAGTKLNKIVTKMCLSEKSRVCSHVRAVFNPTNTHLLQEFGVSINTLLPPPDLRTGSDAELQFDKLLEQKNIECVKYASFLDLLETPLDVSYKKSKRSVYAIFRVLEKYTNVDLFVELYKKHIGKLREGVLCWMIPLLHYIGIIGEMKPIGEYDPINMDWIQNKSGEKIEIDSFVNDKHVGNRKSTSIDFALEGSLVVNEAPWTNADWKRLYVKATCEKTKPKPVSKEAKPKPASKEAKPKPVSKEAKPKPVAKKNVGSGIPSLEFKVDESVGLETDYTFVVRTQLVTSGTKMDVYLAEMNGKLCVVKGPYDKTGPLECLDKITAVKKANFQEYIPYTIRKLIPDRWDKTPLGNRNRIDTKIPHYFVVFDSLLTRECVETKMHESKLWSPTEVVDWDKTNLHLDFAKRKLTDSEMARYVDIVLFRYILGIPDLADRNFMRIDGKVIGIDEDIMGRNVNLKTELKKTRCGHIYKWLQADGNYERLDYWKWDIKPEMKVGVIESREGLMELFRF